MHHALQFRYGSPSHRRLLGGVLMCVLAWCSTAGGQVVIDMPAPKRAAAAVNQQKVEAKPGDVALVRYAYGRSAPRNYYRFPRHYNYYWSPYHTHYHFGFGHGFPVFFSPVIGCRPVHCR